MRVRVGVGEGVGGKVVVIVVVGCLDSVRGEVVVAGRGLSWWLCVSWISGEGGEGEVYRAGAWSGGGGVGEANEDVGEAGGGAGVGIGG